MEMADGEQEQDEDQQNRLKGLTIAQKNAK
jgi:hypothetical protein